MALPWVRLAQLVPTVLGLSRELLDRKQAPRTDVKNLEDRLGTLEETQRREAELVHALAQQAAALAEASASVRRLALAATAVAAVAVVVAVAALVAAL